MKFHEMVKKIHDEGIHPKVLGENELGIYLDRWDACDPIITIEKTCNFLGLDSDSAMLGLRVGMELVIICMAEFGVPEDIHEVLTIEYGWE